MRDALTRELVLQVKQTVRAAVEIAQHKALAAREAGNQAEADQFEAEAREAGKRLEFVRALWAELDTDGPVRHVAYNQGLVG
jgi:hypothetical protein